MKKQKLTLNEEISQMKRMMGKLMNESNNIEDEPYNPIRKAHSEYESPFDRQYNSDEWVQAQRDAEGKKDTIDDVKIEDTLYDRLTMGGASYDNRICDSHGVWIDFEKNGVDGVFRLCFDVNHIDWEPYEPQTWDYPGYPG